MTSGWSDRYRGVAYAVIVASLCLSARAAPGEGDHPEKHRQADELVAAQEFDRAVKLLKKTNDRAGGSCPECLLGLAKSFNLTGEYRKAEKQARQAIGLAEHPVVEAFALNRLGLILFSGGDGDASDFEEAAEVFQKVLDISQGRAHVAYYNLGEVLLKLERDKAGVAALESYLARAPDGPQAPRARLLIADPRRARVDLLPEFALTTLDGEEIRSSDLAGRVVLFDFWATWCGPCVSSVPALRKLNEKRSGEHFVMVSVSADQSGKALEKFISSHEMSWPQHWDRNGPSLQALFRISRYPTYVLVGHDGQVLYRTSGWSSTSELALSRQVKRAIQAAQGVG